jgi:epoxyqueuosine reductase
VTNTAQLTAGLRERAYGEGFDVVAVAAVAPLKRHAAALADWLRHGREAGMGWMERNPDRRADPRALLPGCTHVVSLAINYWPGEQAARSPAHRARVALYAHGRDYHRVMGRKLKRLAAWLQQTSGQAARTFVDTGPVLERAWAERAGMGWIGKNANLLTREMGSWLLLGEILTAAALEVDPGPHAEFCGTCTACLDACPTDAIVRDGVVDSNLCISYWTIEHRGSIPEERRPGIGEWIFGCDVCQEVCPWNRSFAAEAHGDPFERRADLNGLDPETILTLDEREFRERYSGTPLMRAKWEGMRRNACIVLGNRARSASIPTLGRALLDETDAVVRAHAAWALGRIPSGDSRARLEAALELERSPEVVEEIRSALGRRRAVADRT